MHSFNSFRHFFQIVVFCYKIWYILSMKKNDILEVKIIDVGINGEGIAKIDNFVIFVPFALTDEVVRVQLLKVNKNYAYAKLIDILTPSKDRVTPLCPVFKKCGGCNLQHSTYENQLIIKQHIVDTTLRKMLKSKFNVLPTFASPKKYAYRNKMQFPITNNGIGMYAFNSHRLIPLEKCPLSEDWCQKLITIIHQYIKLSGISTYNEETGSGVLRNVLARVTENNIMITIVCNGIPTHLDILADLIQREFINFGLYYNINKDRTNRILGNEFIHISGIKEQLCEDFNIKHTLLPLSFAQINKDVQNAIYSKALELVDKEIVIDAYSGAGLLSAILSKKAEYVYGIEIVKQATENANTLKQLNNISNVTNINGDCAIELPKLIQSLPPCTVILDPPRKGCDKKVIDAILDNEPSKIIYISCNPASLARDLSYLESNYDIRLIQPYDMFPQTKHIETLVFLTKKE